jgi:hypothetical protein
MFVPDQSFKPAVGAGDECRAGRRLVLRSSGCSATAVDSADGQSLRERPFRSRVPTRTEEDIRHETRRSFRCSNAADAHRCACGAGHCHRVRQHESRARAARVNIHGCIRGDAWCDVSWSDDRGWVSSQYLEYLYRNRYVYLPDYVDVVDVPEVPFVLNSYWASYYSGRPWYHRRAYWSSYWQSHARFATQIPADRSTRLGRTETRTAATEGRSHTGVAAGVTREQRLAHVRGAQAAQEQRHLAHVNGSSRSHASTKLRASPPRQRRGLPCRPISRSPTSVAPMWVMWVARR